MALYVSIPKPSDGPRPLYPTCEESAEYDACVTFVNQCEGCHGLAGVLNLQAPPLAGLIGRVRRFSSGESLVADEAYIRRAIANHSDKSERIPGYDVNESQLRELAHDVPSPTMVDALARYIRNLEPYGRIARVRIEQQTAAHDWRIEQIELSMKAAADPISACYQVVLADDPDVRGSLLVEFRADEGKGFTAGIVEDHVSNAVTVGCVEHLISRSPSRRPSNGPLLARYAITFSSSPSPQ